MKIKAIFKTKNKKRRMILWLSSLAFFAIATSLILYALGNNLTYFLSPTQFIEQPAPVNVLLRIGGLVEEGSVIRSNNGLSVRFNITDGTYKVAIDYTGLLPDLFREGQGVVVECIKRKNGSLRTIRILTKHDEKYMPREVTKALKSSGQWRPAP